MPRNLIIFALGVLLLCVAPLRAEPLVTPHVTARLVLEPEEVPLGRLFWAGIQFEIEEGWHLYWKNPGHAGAPPSISWSLPSGFSVGEFAWPIPERIDVGPLVNFGYRNRVLLPLEMSVSGDYAPGSAVVLAGRLDWLVCREECVPGGGFISRGFAIESAQNGVPSRDASLFEEARRLLPKELSDPIRAVINPEEFHLSLPADLLGSSSKIEFFPESKDVIDLAAPQRIELSDGTLPLLHLRRKGGAQSVGRLQGVLVVTDSDEGSRHRTGYSIDSPVETLAPPMSVGANPSAVGFWAALIGAFLGGIILNLMPCVFPVLSLKVFDLLSLGNGCVDRQSGSANSGNAKWQGVLFAIGVIVSCWILAGVLLVIRSAGEGIGWGFQLQSPLFVSFLALLFTTLALSMAGVVDLGASISNRLGGYTTRTGGLGSFLSGCLTTVVATPCTAPFLGSAIAVALTLPWWGSLAVFTSLGMGIATPLLVVILVPRLAALLPRGGAWMSTMRVVLSLPLFLTVTWLLWVLSLQSSVDVAFRLLGLLTVWSIGLWISCQAMGPGRPLSSRRRGAVALIFLTLFVVWFGVPRIDGAMETQHRLTWETFSSERLAEELARGRVVFLDFTAAWCITCHVNHKVVLEQAGVVEALRSRDAVLLRGDWTKRDPEIARFIEDFGRSGVPLNIVYPGKGAAPVILPPVLTTTAVLDALPHGK